MKSFGREACHDDIAQAAGVMDLTNIPPEKARTMASEIDRLIIAADSYYDFVLGALLCTARDHLKPFEDREVPTER